MRNNSFEDELNISGVIDGTLVGTTVGTDEEEIWSNESAVWTNGTSVWTNEITLERPVQTSEDYELPDWIIYIFFLGVLISILLNGTIFITLLKSLRKGTNIISPSNFHSSHSLIENSLEKIIIKFSQ